MEANHTVQPIEGELSPSETVEHQTTQPIEEEISAFETAENETAQPIEGETSPSETVPETTSEPTTAVIVLGDAIIFRPSNEVLSATIFSKEALASCLDKQAEPSSISSLHLIVKANSISTLYDADAIPNFVPVLSPGAEFSVHVMENASDEDIDTIKISLVLANFRVVNEELHEGGTRVLTAKLVE
mmetsp:Transcript_10188/g.11828  ORF Transcript_10188/g.11828 Transcript_10188/m.11828 type:complete len:187 (-) Transcript_10188:393-953(-)